MIEKTGDLFTSDAPALGHGVNVYGVMGAGIAVQFATRWPEMEKGYKQACMATFLNPGGIYVWHTAPNQPEDVVIFNMASQSRPGPDATLEWLADSAYKAAMHAKEDLSSGIDRIAIPRIGCGIGGLDWADVKPVLESIEEETGVQFEVWSFDA